MRLKNKKRFAISVASILIIIAGVTMINKTNSNENLKESKQITSQNIELKEIILSKDLSVIKAIKPEPQEELKIYYDIPLLKELQDFTKETCKKYDVDFETILSIMYTESEFNHKNTTPNQSEHGDSIGLMQLNIGRQGYIDWYSELTDIKPFDPYNKKHNITGGIAVYKFYKTYWENKGYTGEELLIRSVNSYNMGIDGFKKYIKNTGVISRGYDRKIREYKNELETIK